MSGWALLLAAALFGAEAVRAHRREPRAARRSGRSSTLATMAQIGRRPASRLPARLARPPDRALLRRAGVQIDAGDVVAARLASAVAFGVVGLGGAVVAGGALGIVIGGLLLVFGCLYPDLWLRSAAARRAARIERAAPALLDLVAAAVQAGVPLDAAIDGAGRAAGGDLAEELERSRISMALGRPRGEEYRDLSERTGAPTLAALGLALRLSDRLGVPLAESLRDQAARSRAEAARAVQERAARAGPRVLAVVVFVLVPASLLPIAAAVALTVAGALGSSAR
jgi:Flp pilus assembly protein TadB